MQFRTKARAVDLLGKGQIADLPTAITELWKNGFDAYADNLTAEIFLEGYKKLTSPIFLMTDDGKGMSKQDIFEKWLVLGTDSKSRIKNEEEEGIDTLFKKPRTKAGEKGIGRLSVAFLGSPMLMLTKKMGHPLQALFFDWRLLENYNLFLDDIQIPVSEVHDLNSFTKIFEKLKKEFLQNLEVLKDSDGKQIWEKEQLKLKDKILKSVNDIVIPEFFNEEILSSLISQKEDHGSKFVIFEPEEQILSLLNSDSENNDSEFVRSSLAGFTNPFIDNKLPIKTSFPIHKTTGSDYDFLTSKGNFFEPKDFDLADILIEGTFDGKGSFNGELKIYGETMKHTFVNPRKKDERNDYGPVPIKLGYSQGLKKDSNLTQSVWDKINSKVDEYGALYIFRDGFRVLPYGRDDADFLAFDKRRSKRAGTAFFSYRRMFGYLGLERNRNNKLKDKSSREGLINNSAYRVFKDDLIAFFTELANEYFGDKANQPSIFLDPKKKLNEQNEALQEDQKRTKKEKIAYTKSLREYPKLFKEYRAKYKELLDQLSVKINETNLIYSEIEELLDNINKLDLSYIDLLPEEPKSYKPTDLQLDRLEEYEAQIIEFNETIKKDSQDLLARVQKKLEIKDLRNEFNKTAASYRASLEELFYGNKKILKDKFNLLDNEFSERTSNTLKELDFQTDKILNSIQSKQDVIDGLKLINEKFEFLREQVKKETLPLVSHIGKLGFDVDEDLVQGAYRAEYENIKHRWEQTRETAQLGVAVEIIDHEFNVLYSQINSSLDNLEGEVDGKGKSDFIHLKSFFKSLEDKYALLSPLYRISGVTSKEIKCGSIFNYLERFFERRLKDEEIDFKSTPSFNKHIIEIKEPVIHTVFINVINNALYWLRDSPRKEILLDYSKKKDEILIMNSGQPIEKHRLKKIFELFYSNRPNGRGIGLYLSKQSLEENYFEILASNEKEHNKLNGACFIIRPIVN